MTGYPHIERARSLVSQRLANAPWLRGVGYGQTESGPVIVVNVALDHPQIRHWVGSHSMGVPIEIDVVGDIAPQTAGMMGSAPFQCPECGAVLSDGYVTSPGNPFEGAVPYVNQGAALSTQAPEQKFHPAFYIMAAASVAGVAIEVARYYRDRKG
jgi:hypothetical protein